MLTADREGGKPLAVGADFKVALVSLTSEVDIMRKGEDGLEGPDVDCTEGGAADPLESAEPLFLRSRDRANALWERCVAAGKPPRAWVETCGAVAGWLLGLRSSIFPTRWLMVWPSCTGEYRQGERKRC